MSRVITPPPEDAAPRKRRVPGPLEAFKLTAAEKLLVAAAINSVGDAMHPPADPANLQFFDADYCCRCLRDGVARMMDGAAKQMALEILEKISQEGEKPA